MLTHSTNNMEIEFVQVNAKKESMIRSLAFFVVLSCSLSATSVAAPAQREINTPYYSLTITPDGEGIAALSVDSLGKGEFRPSTLFPPEAKPFPQATKQEESPVNISFDWQFKFSSRSFEMASTYRQDASEQPIVLRFDPGAVACHAARGGGKSLGVQHSRFLGGEPSLNSHAKYNVLRISPNDLPQSKAQPTIQKEKNP